MYVMTSLPNFVCIYLVPSKYLAYFKRKNIYCFIHFHYLIYLWCYYMTACTILKQNFPVHAFFFQWNLTNNWHRIFNLVHHNFLISWLDTDVYQALIEIILVINYQCNSHIQYFTTYPDYYVDQGEIIYQTQT